MELQNSEDQMKEYSSQIPMEMNSIPLPENEQDGFRDISSPREASQYHLGPFMKIFNYSAMADKMMHLVGILAAIASGAPLPLMTVILGDLTNLFIEWDTVSENRQITPNEFRRQINQKSLLFVYLFVAKAVLVYIHTTSFTVCATRIVRQLRLQYLKSILRQDMAYFDTCSPGAVATRINTNANSIQAGIAERLGIVIQNLSTLIIALIVAFVTQWKLTLVTITIPLASVLVVYITVIIDGKYQKQILAIQGAAGGLAEEVLGSMRTVVAFDASEKLLLKYAKLARAAAKIGKKRGLAVGVQYSSELFPIFCGYALCFWYGIRLLAKGEVNNPGKVVTALFSVVIGTGSLVVIAPYIGAFTRAAVAAVDVLEMIDKEPSIDSASERGEKPISLTGRIELRNVSFYYPARPTVKVLDDFCLIIPENKITALVGVSGSGKSTIIGLLERWYDPAIMGSGVLGKVYLDGKDIKELNVRWLRTQIGLVQQEPVLFSDTVYENVLHGLAGSPLGTTLSDEEKRKLVESVCIEVNADSFIKRLPQGYDTRVGEHGSLLSGGQKQRIAIARSIVKNPKILLLDEATSALDPENEALVQDALNKASKHRTTVVIAHRLSTVRLADNIVVMRKGSIIEQGSHERLLAMKGEYWRLVNAQNLGAQSGEEKAAGSDYLEVCDSNRSSSDNETDSTALELKRPQTMRSIPINQREQEESSSQEKISRRLSSLICFGRIFSEQRKHWLWYISALIGCVIGGAVFPVQAIIFSNIIGVFTYSGDRLVSAGNFWSLMFFVAAIAVLIAYMTIGFTLTVFGVKVDEFYRVQYFRAIVKQDIEFFDREENASGSLTSQLSLYPSQLHELISNSFGLLLIAFVTILGSCALALAVWWRLALVAIFGCLPLIFGSGFLRIKLEMKLQDSTAKLFLQSAGFASEAVGAIRTVSSLTLEPQIYDRYKLQLSGPVQQSYKQTLIGMAFFGLCESLELLGMGLAFWYGGQLLSIGEKDTTKFFTVFMAIVFGGQAAGYMFADTTSWAKAHAAANHIIYLREQHARVNMSTGGSAVPPSQQEIPSIEFRDVTFHYPSRHDVPVLKGISMKIFRGQTIGLVGSSGCGKTTIISLLERFYDVTSGTILINEKPLTEIDIKDYRGKVSFVSQEPTLYQGSIKENILLGISPAEESNSSSEYLEERVVKAAMEANIHSFIISLPEGYNTEVGRNGLSLSGGQRQRIAIARALIRDPQIILLDEATSALDTENEKAVQSAIERASKGKTTLIVAHRLSTVKDADCIFVFGDGRIVEFGSHEELLRKRGIYYEMCKGQGLDMEV